MSLLHSLLYVGVHPLDRLGIVKNRRIPRDTAGHLDKGHVVVLWCPAVEFEVLVQFSWATSDLWLIQQNKFY